MFPFATYNIYIVVILLTTFISTSKYVKRKYFLLITSLNSFVIIKLVFGINGTISLSDLSELKIILFLNILILTEKYTTNQLNSKILKISFIIFGFICLAYSLIYLGRFTRFIDFIPFYSHYLSIYFGVSAALLWSVYQNSITLPFFVLISGSGTAILACLPILLAKLIYGKNIRIFIFYFLLLIFMFSTLLIVQYQTRGRMLSDISTIDRILFYIGFYKYLIIDINPMQFIVGHSFGEHIPIDKHFPEGYREYLLNERDGYIPPRMFHSDFMRIFLQYGLIGTILTGVLLWRIFAKNRLLLAVLLFAGLTNAIIYITPIFVVAFYLLKRNIKDA